MNAGDLRRNSGDCHRGACEYGVVGSPKFQGRANHEVQTVNWNTLIFEAESA